MFIATCLSRIDRVSSDVTNAWCHTENFPRHELLATLTHTASVLRVQVRG